MILGNGCTASRTNLLVREDTRAGGYLYSTNRAGGYLYPTPKVSQNLQ